MLNVLIAIVSDSYIASYANSRGLFWKARMDLITELSAAYSTFLPKVLQPSQKSINSMLKHELGKDAAKLAGTMTDIVKQITHSEMAAMQKFMQASINELKADLKETNALIRTLAPSC
jgi:hypothetical protein